MAESLAFCNTLSCASTAQSPSRGVLRQVLRFVLSRGSVGEIEYDASYQRDDHPGKK